MRVIFLAAALGAGLSTAAAAADMDFGPLRGTQQLTPVQGWEGVYVGGFVGASQTNFDFNDVLVDDVEDLLRLTAIEADEQISRYLKLPEKDGRDKSFGGFVGYNMQFDEIVFGVEGDYTRARMSANSTDFIARSVAVRGNGYYFENRGNASAEIEDFGTLRVRAGYTLGSFMPFVTIGGALGRVTVSESASIDIYENGVYVPFTFRSDDKEKYALGFAAGAGIEAALGHNFFVRGEWQYIYFTDIQGLDASVNTLRAAAGVKF